MKTRAHRSKKGRSLLAALLGLLAVDRAAPRPAAAYEADSTLAGLTQQAALASRLHRVLVERFGRSQGVFDPLRLRLARLAPEEARSLRARLLRLDPAEGYAPEDLSVKVGAVSKEGLAQVSYGLRSPERQTALGWLTAGSVLESLPPGRMRNHFLDGRTGAGLTLVDEERRGGVALKAVARGLATTRELMTGVAFDGTGEPALAWLQQPRDDLSLRAYRRAYAAAVTAPAEDEREAALVQALLAAGAVLGVLGQLGDPAHVRNDPDPLVGGGAYQAFVAQRYGRAGIPAPLPEKGAPQLSGARRLASLFHVEAAEAGSGEGLAERTARRFFSVGSLPGTTRGEAALRPAGLPPLIFTGAGSQNSRIGETRVPRGWSQAEAGYVGDREVPHRAAWRRLREGAGEPPRLRWFLDERCYADYAAVLLPEIGRYQVVALELLLGGDLRLERAAVAGELSVSYGGPGQLKSGQVTVLGEDKQGQRRVLQAVPLRAGGELLWQGPVPAELKRAAVLVEGVDDQGEPVITSAELALSL